MFCRILAVAVKHLDLRYRYIVRYQNHAKSAYNMIFAYNVRFGI